MRLLFFPPGRLVFALFRRNKVFVPPEPARTRTEVSTDL